MPPNTPDLLSETDEDISVVPYKTADEAAFADYYDREVSAALDALEVARVAVVAESARRMRIGWLAIFPVAVVLFGWIAAKMDGRVFIFGLLVTSALIGNWCADPKRKFEASRDDAIIPRIVGYFPGFTYRRDVPADQNALYEAVVIPMGDRQDGGDAVKGVHAETEVRMSELSTYKRVQSGKSSHYVQLFKGLLISMEFEKPFDGVTVVERGWDQNGYVTEALRGGKTMEVVALEDPDFEKKFRVRSTDQVEARYLLTPDFMTRLYDLSTGGQAQGLRCSFVNKRFHLAVPTERNYFELGSSDSQMSNLEQALIIYRDIRDALAIMDVLKINAGRRVRTASAPSPVPPLPPPPAATQTPLA